MSLREGIGDSIRQNGGKKDNPAAHARRAYARAFEGCTPRRVLSADGKRERLVQEYTGKYYRRCLPRGQNIRHGMACAALWLAASFLYGSAAVRPLACNMVWYAVLPQSAAIVFLCWLGVCLVFCFGTGAGAGKMREHAYRGGPRRLRYAALGSAASLLAAALLSALCAALRKEPESFSCAVQLLLAAALPLAIWRSERRVLYTSHT